MLERISFNLVLWVNKSIDRDPYFVSSFPQGWVRFPRNYRLKQEVGPDMAGDT
jgi:hypothetical protein